MRPSHLIHRCLALDGALRHRARRKVSLARIVVPRAHTRLPVEGLPDDPVWQTRSGRAFEGAEAQVESVLRAADAVVNPVASRGEAPLAIGEGGARKAHAYLRLAVGASAKWGGDSALGICATVVGRQPYWSFGYCTGLHLLAVLGGAHAEEEVAAAARAVDHVEARVVLATRGSGTCQGGCLFRGALPTPRT